MSSEHIDKRTEMEARLTLRSKQATKEEKEAAASVIADAEGLSRSDPTGADGGRPLSKDASHVAKRPGGSEHASRRGGDR